MRTFEHMIGQAWRRELLARMAHLAGWGLLLAAVGGLVLLLIDRWFALGASAMAFLASGAMGLIAGAVAAVLTRTDRLGTAVRLDRALRLKDRMGTAQVLTVASLARHHDEHFATLATQQAQTLAASIDVRSATPIQLTRVWWPALLLAAALWCGFMFLPARPAPTQSPQEQAQDARTHAPQQARELAQAIEQAAAEIPPDLPLDQASQDELKALDDLGRQLAANPTVEDVQAARDESAARIGELADRLAEQSQRDLSMAEEVTRRFKGLDSLDAPKPPMSAQELDEALRRGDFGQASEALEHLLSHDTSLTDQERAEAAEHLRKLAQEIEQTATTQPGADDDHGEHRERIEQLTQALRDQGLDDQAIDELMEEPAGTDDDIAQELKERGVDEEVAHDLASDLERLNEQRQREAQADQATREVGESLERAADTLEQQPPSSSTTPSEPQTQPDAPAPTAQPPGTQPPAGGAPPTSPQQQQGHDQTVNQKQQREGQSQEQSELATEREPQTQPPDQSGKPQSQQRDSAQQRETADPLGRRSEGKADERPDPQRQDQATQPSTQPRQGQATQPQSSDQSQSAQPTSEQQTEQAPQSQPGESSADQQQQQQQEQQQQPGQQSPPDALRRLAERFSQAQDQRQSSERLRELARELMEKSTPEERRRWADAAARELQQQQQQRQSEPASGEQQPLDPETERQLQELAREMADQMSPQERRELAERMSRQGHSDPQQQQQTGEPGQRAPEGEVEQDDAQRGGGRGDDRGRPGDRAATQRQTPPNAAPTPDSNPPASEEVDLRGLESADKLIAQWLSEQQAVESGDRGEAPGRLGGRVRRAQDIAERAVNDAAVQKRYHKLIKRYFDRLDRTVQKASEPANP